MRRLLRTAAALVACSYLVAGLAGAPQAVAAPSSTTLTAGFSPARLGAASTIELGFQIHRPGEQVPPPLLGVNFSLPAGVSLTSSELGLNSCTRTTLVSAGSEGCQPDSVMGYGSALLIAPDAAENLVEPVHITVLMAPAEDHHTSLLFYANGGSPIIAQTMFSGQLVEASRPFGATLDATIPLTSGLPGEPDTSVVRMHASIGSLGVTYYKRVRGTEVAYTPKGVVVPLSCPAGGFPFSATFKFADGSDESAATTAPCPSHGHHTHSRRRRLK